MKVYGKVNVVEQFVYFSDLVCVFCVVKEEGFVFVFYSDNSFLIVDVLFWLGIVDIFDIYIDNENVWISCGVIVLFCFIEIKDIIEVYDEYFKDKGFKVEGKLF